MVYETEQAALQRIDRLRVIGIWPGVIRTQDGWRLTYDPPVTRIEVNAHGYLLGAS